MRSGDGLLLKFALCAQLLRRFLRRFVVARNGRPKMLVGRHQVVSHRHGGRVSQPACDHLNRAGLDKFSLSTQAFLRRSFLHATHHLAVQR
jgi:hypothetical protein